MAPTARLQSRPRPRGQRPGASPWPARSRPRTVGSS